MSEVGSLDRPDDDAVAPAPQAPTGRAEVASAQARRPRVLVLTMRTNEADFPFCASSVAAQQGVTAEQLVIEGLDNSAAHEAVYRTIMERRDAFDAFLKLDADMVLRDSLSLGNMVGLLAAKGLDHVMWPVADHLCGGNIYGVHLFSPRVSWTLPVPAIFVDPAPSFAGGDLIIGLDTLAPVNHCYFASKRQAFDFGAHRAIKVFHSTIRGEEASIGALQTLRRVWKAFLCTGDPLRALALAGAEAVRSLAAETDDYKRDPALADRFDRVSAMGSDELKRHVAGFWRLRADLTELALRARRYARRRLVRA